MFILSIINVLQVGHNIARHKLDILTLFPFMIMMFFFCPLFDTRQNLYALTLFTVHSNLSYDNAGVRPPFRFMYYHIRKMYTFANKGRSRPRFSTKVVLSGDRKKKGLLQTIKLTIGKRRGRVIKIIFFFGFL